MVDPAIESRGVSRSLSDGSRSVPSQPSRIVPSGARSTPPWMISEE